jgi:hypothetical protein
MNFRIFKLLIITLPFIFSMSSCSLGIKSSLTKSYAPLNLNDSVKVFGLSINAPSNAEILGTVRIYDAGTLNCGYDVVIAAAKNEARKAGGNGLKITEHIPPSIWSSCHQITAIILRLDSTYINVNTSQHNNIPEAEQPVNKQPEINNKNYKAFFLAAEAGWSWRTNKIDPYLNSFLKEYLSDLKSGNHYGFSGTYYTSRGFGIGFVYDKHISSNSVNATAYDSSTGQSVSGVLRDNISINFIGASCDFRGFSRNEKNSVHLKIALGYTGYKDEGGFIDEMKINGSTFGINYDISYDIFLSDQWYISPAISYKVAALSSFDLTSKNQTQHIELEKGSYEGLTRFDLSAGLRYRF